jgi:hypothetical protein
MKGSQESLTTVVIKGWPTPNAADSLQGGTTQGNRKDPNLSIAVHGPHVPASSSMDGSRPESWQTATVSTGAHKQKDGSMIDKLDQQVKSWATPRTKDAEGWMMNQARLAAGKPEDTLTGQTTQSNKSNGKLNPRWVCTLMNVPVFWVKP